MPSSSELSSPASEISEETRLDFDRDTIPWVDRDDFESVLPRRLESGRLTDADAEMLHSWRRDGYVVLPEPMDDTLVTSLLGDYERFWRKRPKNLVVLAEGLGVTPFPELPPREDLTHHHYRVQDIQDESQTARKMILHAKLVHALRLIFDETPVAMQSLFFEYGSEQGVHQDFPYVQAHHLSHLVGCWMACDDVDDDNGPLFYYPGSHRLPKFDWGGGNLVFDVNKDDPAKVDQFSAHLADEAEAAGLERKVFHARRGQVFLWHGALVHGGSAVVDPRATRRSLVVHYSTRSGYPRDRRALWQEPKVFKRNGGLLYERPQPRLRSRIKQVLRRLLKGPR